MEVAGNVGGIEGPTAVITNPAPPHPTAKMLVLRARFSAPGVQQCGGNNLKPREKKKKKKSERVGPHHLSQTQGFRTCVSMKPRRSEELNSQI